MTPPTFSILTPVYNPPTKVLRRMLDSVRRQTFTEWEHCLVDDAADRSRVWPLLERAAAEDARIRVRRAEAQGGIVAASNGALALASGEFVALLDHDDELDPNALAAIAERIVADAEVDYLYSDEDKADRAGRYFDPFIKPTWSPDRLACQMYTGHLSVLRRALVDEVGGFREGFDGSQDWDLVLRVTERARRIVHVPEVLYHWRTLRASAASQVDAKPWAHAASRLAVREHVKREGIEAEVEDVPGYPGCYWLAPSLREEPLVSLVIPTGGASQAIEGTETPLVVNCVRSVLRRSTHENLEIVVVVDQGVGDDVRESLTALAGDRLRLVEFERPFNFSAKINLGVRESEGKYVLLLNDDIEVLPRRWRPRPRRSPHPAPQWPIAAADGRRAWIEAMLVYARRPGVGAVGGKLYFPDGDLQHAGVVGFDGAPGHPYYGEPGNSGGYYGNLVVACNYLAVTAACLMTTRSAFDSVGGFGEDRPVNYNDVDYCLKLRDQGLRSVMLPWVEMLHRESASRGQDAVPPAEIEAIRAQWGDLLGDDPYYDRRFIGGGFRLEGPPPSYAAKARHLLAEGGVGLLASRGLGKLRRRVRERVRG